jgi:hypothetical protein
VEAVSVANIVRLAMLVLKRGLFRNFKSKTKYRLPRWHFAPDAVRIFSARNMYQEWGKNMYTKFLNGKHQRKIALCRPKGKWQENINTDLKIGCENVNWIQLAKDIFQW